LFGFQLKGLIPSVIDQSRESIIDKICISIRQKMQAGSTNDLQSLLTGIKPTIESHVDHFLKHKLKELFPLLFPLMGEKTIGKFREAFLNEIDLLFPGIMQQVMNELSGENYLRERVSENVKALDSTQISTFIVSMPQQPLKKIPWVFAFTGLIAGLLTLLMLCCTA
jgi:hypothetical protein